MVVIANLLDTMCATMCDQACGPGPGYPTGQMPTDASSAPSEDVAMADASAPAPPTDDGRQSNNGSPTGQHRSGSPRSSPSTRPPSPGHFLKFRGKSDWQSLVRRTSCGANSNSSSRTASPSAIQGGCFDVDNAQMALAHARRQVQGAHRNNKHNKRKASSDIFRSRQDEADDNSLAADADDLPERAASPVPLGCGPTAMGMGGVARSAAAGLLRFPGLCFANPVRGSASLDEHEQEQDNAHLHSAARCWQEDRPASPAYLFERDLAEAEAATNTPPPMPLYRSQEIVHASSSSSDDAGEPICLTTMIANTRNPTGAKKMRLTAPSAPSPATGLEPKSFHFSSSSDHDEDAGSVDSAPAAAVTAAAVEGANSSPTATTSASVAVATPSPSRPHKQARRGTTPSALHGIDGDNEEGIQSLMGLGPSVPELDLFQQAPRTPAQQTSGLYPHDEVHAYPVTPEKPYLDV